jgi:hypothetical protein
MCDTVALSSTVPTPTGPEALLDQLVQEFSAAERCLTRHYPETGRLAQDYILARKAQGQGRATAVQEIAGRLAAIAGKPIDVNRLIGGWNVAAILGSGVDFAAMPFCALREFIQLLHRDRQTEAWGIVAGLEKAARALFRKAAEGRLDTEGVWRAIKLLRGRDRAPTPEPVHEHNPLAHLASADPRKASRWLGDTRGAGGGTFFPPLPAHLRARLA